MALTLFFSLFLNLMSLLVAQLLLAILLVPRTFTIGPSRLSSITMFTVTTTVLSSPMVVVMAIASLFSVLAMMLLRLLLAAVAI